MTNETEYIELGLACADVCGALSRGVDGKKLGDLSQSVCGAITQLATWVKPFIRALDSSLTKFSIAELWERSKGRPQNRANGMRSRDSCMRRMTRKRSPVGSQTSTGSFTFSTCVPSLSYDNC